MKPHWSAYFATLCVCLLQGGCKDDGLPSSSEGRVAEANAILKRMPPREALMRDLKEVHDDSNSTTQRVDYPPIKRISEAARDFQRLRLLIEPGRTLQDYPQLLSHGTEQRQRSGNTSRAYLIGYPSATDQGPDVTLFRIEVNTKGIITAVETMIASR